MPRKPKYIISKTLNQGELYYIARLGGRIVFKAESMRGLERLMKGVDKGEVEFSVAPEPEEKVSSIKSYRKKYYGKKSKGPKKSAGK